MCTRVLVILLRSRPRCSITEKTFTFRTTLQPRESVDPRIARRVSTPLSILIFSIRSLYKKRKINYLCRFLQTILIKRTNFSFMGVFIILYITSLFSIDNCYYIRHDRTRKTGRPRYIVGGLKGWSWHGRKSRVVRKGGRMGEEGSFRSKANRSAPWSSGARHKDPPRRCPDLKTSRLSLSPPRITDPIQLLYSNLTPTANPILSKKKRNKI